VGGGVQTGSTRHVAQLLAYCTCPGWVWGWRIWWDEWQGKAKYSEKTCPGATLSTTNPTWPDPGLNPGRRSGKPTTNRFSYGAATSPLNYSTNKWNNCFSLYGSTALCWDWTAFSVSWSFTQSVRLLERGISPSQGRYLHTWQHKHRINTHKHSCLKWDSNPRSKCLSERRQCGHCNRQLSKCNISNFWTNYDKWTRILTEISSPNARTRSWSRDLTCPIMEMWMESEPKLYTDA
jgi:hypothetical protein